MVSFQYSNFIDSNIQCQTDFGAPLAVVSNNAGRHQAKIFLFNFLSFYLCLLYYIAEYKILKTEIERKI